MITCMGLIVGMVESASAQDVLNKCAKFLKKYKHLLDTYPRFIIDGVEYCRVIDTHVEKGNVYVLCRMYDGRTMMGTSE